MEPKIWDIELRRTGNTAKLKLTILKSGVEAVISLSELEHIALYLADHVGKWRDELIEIEEKARS
jgi:hypothetical protein